MFGNHIYIDRTENKGRKVLADDSHRLSSQFQPVKFERHLRAPLAKAAFKKYFIPNEIHIVN